MPLVNVMVNARAYTIACDDGEQEHLKELAAHVDAKVRELIGSVGQVGDQKLMLMAALLVTDEFFEVRGRIEGHAKASKELASAKTDFDTRIADAEKRAAGAVKDAETRTARAVEAAEKHAAEVEKQAARSVEDAERRATDAEARAAQAVQDAEKRVAQAIGDMEGKGASVSAEAEDLAALELDEAASRLERIVEKLKVA
jgi:cell division protein ZapA